MPIIANPSAAEATKQLGFQPSVLQPGELLGKKIREFSHAKATRKESIEHQLLRSLTLGDLQISAVPGSVVGPPWQDPENGYVQN